MSVDTPHLPSSTCAPTPTTHIARQLDVFNNQVQHLFASFEREAARSFHHDHVHDPLYYTADVVTSNNESLSNKPSPIITSASQTAITTPGATALKEFNLTQNESNNTVNNNKESSFAPTLSQHTRTLSSASSSSTDKPSSTLTLSRPSSGNNIFATPASPRLNSAGRTHSHTHSASSRTHSNSPRASPRTLGMRNLHNNFRVNVLENANEFIITAVLPSCKHDELHVSVSDGMLIVSGERKQCCNEHSVQESNSSQLAHNTNTHATSAATPGSPPHKTRDHSGSSADDKKLDIHSSPAILYGIKLKDQITQSLMLPADVDQSKVRVKYDRDTLIIELPKLQSAKLSTISSPDTIDVIPEE